MKRLADDFFKYRQALQGEFSDMVAAAGLLPNAGGAGGAGGRTAELNNLLAESHKENDRLQGEVVTLQDNNTSILERYDKLYEEVREMKVEVRAHFGRYNYIALAAANRGPG
eukprot:SAG22_NODE_3647_length_1597_cov_1.019359_2_plen_112_part_00